MLIIWGGPMWGPLLCLFSPHVHDLLVHPYVFAQLPFPRTTKFNRPSLDFGPVRRARLYGKTVAPPQAVHSPVRCSSRFGPRPSVCDIAPPGRIKGCYFYTNIYGPLSEGHSSLTRRPPGGQHHLFVFPFQEFPLRVYNCWNGNREGDLFKSAV